MNFIAFYGLCVTTANKVLSGNILAKYFRCSSQTHISFHSNSNQFISVCLRESIHLLRFIKHCYTNIWMKYEFGWRYCICVGIILYSKYEHAIALMKIFQVSDWVLSQRCTLARAMETHHLMLIHIRWISDERFPWKWHWFITSLKCHCIYLLRFIYVSKWEIYIYNIFVTRGISIEINCFPPKWTLATEVHGKFAFRFWPDSILLKEYSKSDYYINFMMCVAVWSLLNWILLQSARCGLKFQQIHCLHCAFSRADFSAYKSKSESNSNPTIIL